VTKTLSVPLIDYQENCLNLKGKFMGDPVEWQGPILTSRFTLLSKDGGKDQAAGRQKLSKLWDAMGHPTVLGE
jgi:hypothetical protein